MCRYLTLFWNFWKSFTKSRFCNLYIIGTRFARPLTFFLIKILSFDFLLVRDCLKVYPPKRFRGSPLLNYPQSSRRALRSRPKLTSDLFSGKRNKIKQSNFMKVDLVSGQVLNRAVLSRVGTYNEYRLNRKTF